MPEGHLPGCHIEININYAKLLEGLRWVNLAQVVFANNPISGLLMLVGLFLADVLVGLVAIYTSAIAVLVAVYSGQDKDLVQVKFSFCFYFDHRLLSSRVHV